MEDTDSGLLQPVPAPSLSRTPGYVSSTRSVQPGEHSVDILSELGFTSDQVTKLIDNGTVKQYNSSKL